MRPPEDDEPTFEPNTRKTLSTKRINSGKAKRRLRAFASAKHRKRGVKGKGR